MTQSLVGNLLVASTLVTESVFARGVCLMMHHDDDGAIAGMWHVLPATADKIFGAESDLWPLLIRRATGSTLAHWVGAPDNLAAVALN